MSSSRRGEGTHTQDARGNGMRRRGKAKGKPEGSTREGEHAGPADAISSARHCTTVRVCTGGNPRSAAGSTTSGGNGEVRTSPRPYRDRLDRGSRRHACRPQSRHEAAKLGQRQPMFPIGGGLRTAAALPSFHTARLAAAELGSLQWLRLLVMLQRPQASKKNYSRPQPASAGRGQPSYILHTARAEKSAGAPSTRVRSVCFFPHECIAIDSTVDSMITHHRRGQGPKSDLRGTHLPERRPEGKEKNPASHHEVLSTLLLSASASALMRHSRGLLAVPSGC